MDDNDDQGMEYWQTVGQQEEWLADEEAQRDYQQWLTEREIARIQIFCNTNQGEYNAQE